MAQFHNTVILKGSPEYDALKRATEKALLEAKEQIERLTAACTRARQSLNRVLMGEGKKGGKDV